MNQLIIPNGGFASNAVDLQNKVFAALLIPDGYLEGAISFQASPDGETFYNLYDSAGALVSVTVPDGGNRIVAVTGAAQQALATVNHIRITTEFDASAERVITLLTKQSR